jgi:hypothetical protein
VVVIDNLRQFDLHFPGDRIDDVDRDRDWAWENQLVLYYVQDLFAEAVLAYSLFLPLTVTEDKVHRLSRCEMRLNSLYAKAFVFALDGIEKLFSRLTPPKEVIPLCDKYKMEFGHLKHIRDSAIHIEDRGLGKDRYKRPLENIDNMLRLGCFFGTSITNRYGFTGEDGKYYGIEISDTTLLKAQELIQDIINAYPWVLRVPNVFDLIMKQVYAVNMEDDLSSDKTTGHNEGETMLDDKLLITHFNRLIQRCNKLAVISKKALETPVDINDVPIDEYIKIRNEQTCGEACFNDLQETFAILEPLFRDLGYSDVVLKHIEETIRTAAKQ